MFDAALARIGFQCRARNVSEYNGVKGETMHDLDRVYACDEIENGIEIKNTLS